jgi:RNA polymerase sigma-70 factor (ECF subfamily)
LSVPDPESDPDLELVGDLRSDDAERRRRALGLLYERYSRRVFNVAWRVLGDWGAAQDVTQDVFLHLGRRIGTWRGDAGLSSWIYRVTVNRAIDSRRREMRRPAQRMDEAALEGIAARMGPQRGEPPEEIDRDVEAARVQRALSRLSPKLRAIAVLRYLEGLSYEELAEVLHCSIGTVKSRLNRAHAALARELGPPPEGPAGSS